MDENIQSHDIMIFSSTWSKINPNGYILGTNKIRIFLGTSTFHVISLNAFHGQKARYENRITYRI